MKTKSNVQYLDYKHNIRLSCVLWLEIRRMLMTLFLPISHAVGCFLISSSPSSFPFLKIIITGRLQANTTIHLETTKKLFCIILDDSEKPGSDRSLGHNGLVSLVLQLTCRNFLSHPQLSLVTNVDIFNILLNF